MVGWDAVCLALCVHATRVHLASGQFPARGGMPTSSYPPNFNMGQAPPQASLSSYDQEILSKGPPGIGAGAASDTPPMNPQGPTYGSGGGYVYPYPRGAAEGYLAPSPPVHIPSIYTTTYSSAAAAGEAAAERAVAKMRAKPLPNPFAPLQNMQAAQAAQQQATMEAEGAFAHINTTPIKALPLQTTASVVKSALSPLHERAKAVHGQGASSGSVFADAVGTAKKLAKQTAHAKRMRQRLAREAARAVKEEQAATLGGIRSYGGRDGAGPPVLSRSMTVIFVTVTVAAIMGVIWYVRQAEPKKDETDDDKLFAQSSQQYV